MDLDQADADVKFVLHDRDAIFHARAGGRAQAVNTGLYELGMTRPARRAIAESLQEDVAGRRC
jgi:hypothetical protein